VAAGGGKPNQAGFTLSATFFASLIDDVRIYERAVNPPVVSTTNGTQLVFVSFQLALNPSSVGFNTLPAFSVVFGLVVVHPEKTGVASLYGFEQHNHPHLSSRPSAAIDHSAGCPFPAQSYLSARSAGDSIWRSP
jgi:hypothetical protein